MILYVIQKQNEHRYLVVFLRFNQVRKAKMKTRMIIIGLFYIGTMSIVAQKNIIIQENVNLRATENTKGKVLSKLIQLSRVKVISQGKSDTVNGFIDHWYKVETEKKLTGYLFGYFTSLKKEGQKNIIALFTGCSMGDLYHLEFDNGKYDFGEGQNNLGQYELCIGDDMDVTGNPKYLNKKFELIINDLVSRVCCDPSCEETCIKKVPTIVELKLIE